MNEVILKEMLGDVAFRVETSQNWLEKYNEACDAVRGYERETEEYDKAVEQRDAIEWMLIRKVKGLMNHADVLKTYMSNFNIEDEE